MRTWMLSTTFSIKRAQIPSLFSARYNEINVEKTKLINVRRNTGGSDTLEVLLGLGQLLELLLVP